MLVENVQKTHNNWRGLAGTEAMRKKLVNSPFCFKKFNHVENARYFSSNALSHFSMTPRYGRHFRIRSYKQFRLFKTIKSNSTKMFCDPVQQPLTYNIPILFENISRKKSLNQRNIEARVQKLKVLKSSSLSQINKQNQCRKPQLCLLVTQGTNIKFKQSSKLRILRG